MSYTDLTYKFKKIGKNVEIGRNVYFRYPDEVEIGNDVIIDDFCYFTTSVKLGNNIHIGPGCTVIGGKSSKFIMDNFSGMAAGTRVICSSDDFIKGPFTNPTIPIEYRPYCKVSSVHIKEHAILGTNTVIHAGIIIGEGAATGSFTLVTKDLEPWGVYTGIPSKKIKERPKNYILNETYRYLTEKKDN